MSRYPEDLLQDVTKETALEKARLEQQKVQADKGLLGDPKDNVIYNIEKVDKVTPAMARQSIEVLARYNAATELSLPKGRKVEAEANIATLKTAFGIVDPVTVP